MSSTEFNVGLIDGRSSSRVLKPPGGGHSNIFGNAIDEKPKIKARQQSEIKSCLDFSEHKKETITIDNKIYENEQKQENGENKDKNIDLKEQENAPPEKKTEEGKSVPQRVRVPPGGFSSGLW